MAQIGRFQITRELGRGGMGVVHEALDPVIGRTVAVKTIRVDTSAQTDFLLDRLFREARSAGALAHPGIVIIFDVGRDGDLGYIAMERVDGPTLESMLESDRRPPHSFVLDVLRQTADALDHAHECGIVHRDIKPPNIMLHKGKTVKVTDFGIAKIQDTQHKSSQIMGTPKYMSPEHITGKPVDGRSDQFALAVIAYQMLTGEMPFPGDDVGTLVYQIVHEERPRATAANPTLRAGVDAVLQRAFAKDPNQRYATCGDFVGALRGALTETMAGPIVIPQPASIPVPPVLRRRSKVTLWYAGAVLAASLVVWLAYTSWNRRTPAGPAKTEPPITGRKPGDTKVNPRDNLTYVWIPPGDFDMGCSPDDNECGDYEKPRHHITLTKGFWIGQTEVTQEAYRRVIGSNPSEFKGDKRPVEKVTWDESKAYCEAVGMRLPTEAEWEYAARGGDPTARDGALDAIAWYEGNSENATHEVAQKQKNGYGVYDMLGNVCEWVADEYHHAKYLMSGPHPPLRVLRGGGWNADPRNVRVSSVNGVPPERQYFTFGVRCVGE